MRLARVRVHHDGTEHYAAVVAAPTGPGGPDGIEYVLLERNPFDGSAEPLRQPDGPRIPARSVTLLSPVPDSAKAVGIGRNYAGTVDGPGDSPLFLKPSTSLLAHGEPIVQPAFSDEIGFEAELAVVIGRTCSRVPHGSAQEYVLGYTCANDVTARDAQRSDGQWTRAKGFDTSCPIGPWIVTGIDVADLGITARRNGVVVQHGRTSQMLLEIAGLIERVSAAMTLNPGDVLLTGTPVGAGGLSVGDEIEVEIESVGRLANRVVAIR
ncbi:fumarylacetoacetate hydrolase family protein [Streptomyces litmocidini]|uniref:Fumarylacetoacetate hydrolase family protein n=1 Tax=Streptomyces litmocidini TaxID=67318 RepID=A0ABW7UKD6_9ACTN|nr:fumarylacetoacetate hydrolase family protein [Streptomyces sp. PanSC19]ROQ35197.1 2-keto-4-pentenoate hydratase/2-oxohepta-3-ene-1,7-dioic acid hydratase in catechol pathway [Streptomyces sp. PanSC19]